MKTQWILVTDGCNHLSTMKNGSHCETERRDKNTTPQKKNWTEMCHPVIRQRCVDAVSAESRVNHLLLKMTGRETKQIISTETCSRQDAEEWTRLTDTWEQEEKHTMFDTERRDHHFTAEGRMRN